MITAEEFVLEIDNKEENKNFKLATVVELFDNNTAKIQFDGEDTPSEKQYAYLDSYVPSIEDRVLLGVLGGTYVILGKVNYNVSPSTEEEVDRYLFDLKKVIMQKGLNVSGGINTDTLTTDDLAVDGDIGVSGEVTANGISSTGSITGTSVNVSGEVKGSNLDVSGQVKGQSLSITNAITVAGLTSTGVMNANNIFYAKNGFLHTGTHLSFYNKGSLVAKITVGQHYGTPTVENLQSKLNSLIAALQQYGLIN